MRVAIIGGGISGLSAAYYLAKRGVEAVLIESRPRLGGVIHTEYVDGCTIEAGPDSFLSSKPAALDLIRDLGLEDQVIGSNDHLRRTYVRRNGRLVPLPDGLMMMAPTRIWPMIATDLVGWGTKLRMAAELARRPAPAPADESVTTFIERHYGREAVDYLVEPLLSGIYGGNPDELSARSVLTRFVDLAEKYGSITRGVLAARSPASSAPLFSTLKGGLQQLIDALTTAIRGKVQVIEARAETIERMPTGFRVRVGADWIEAGRVMVATEAHSASKLIAPLDGRVAELLSAVPYTSSMLVTLGYHASDFNGRLPDGFGFLVPKKERRRVVACTWVATKFPNRAPEGTVLARCFLGGRDDPSVLNESDETILETVTAELRDIAGITASPRFHRIYRWPCSMAQYTVGHQERQRDLESRVAAIGGLSLAGNAYQGIGIPDCIRMGKAAAQQTPQ